MKLLILPKFEKSDRH